MAFKKLKRSSKEPMTSPPKIELAYKVLYQKKNKSNIKKTNQRQPKSLVNIQQKAPNNRIWRKTIVFAKTKPKIKLPRLFRADSLTGLPLDYERTVLKIMHYVNPHLSSSPSPDQLMEELLTRTLVGYVENWSRTNQSPQSLKDHLHMILRNKGTQSAKKDIHNDENLCKFHCAWLVLH